MILRHPDNVELVDNYRGVREHGVWSPHIHCHIANLVAVSALAQIGCNRVFVAVVQHVQDGLLFDVGDHATLLDDVGFVNPKPLRHLEFERLFQPLTRSQ